MKNKKAGKAEVIQPEKLGAPQTPVGAEKEEVATKEDETPAVVPAEVDPKPISLAIYEGYIQDEQMAVLKPIEVLDMYISNRWDKGVQKRRRSRSEV